MAPLEETDIQIVIRCSKKLGIQIRVKRAGHDYEGLSVHSKSPFVLIDLTNLNSIDINLTEKMVWVQARATLGHLYYQIANKSKTYAFPAGLCKGLGLGGHISSGGLGTLVRKYGLAADNVLDARFMDVDGYIMDRSSMGEEIFWAPTGGGGASFGVILAWKLKLVRVPEQGPLHNLSNCSETEDCFRAPVKDSSCSSMPCIKKECYEVSWIQSAVFFSEGKTNQPAETLLSKFKNTRFFNKATSDFLKAPIPYKGWEMIQKMFLSEDGSYHDY